MSKNKPRKKSLISKSCFVNLVLLVLLSFPSVSKAIGAGGVAAGPAYPDPNVKYSDSYFIYNLDKGESKEDGIKIVNTSKEESVLVKLYPVDAAVTKQGAFAPLAEEDLRQDIGAWIKLSTSEVTLGPEEVKIIPFTITIPENADVGDHLGAIMVERAKLPTVEGTGIVIKARVGIRVYETVPGEIKRILKISNIVWKIGVKKLSPKPSTGEKIQTILGLRKEGVFEFEIKNEGNVHLNPSAYIEITDIFGNHVASLQESLRITKPGGTTFIPVNWEKPPVFGRLTAQIDVLFGEGEKTSTKLSIWIIPWTVIFVIVLLIVIGIFVKLFWKLFYLILKLRRMPNMLSYKITEKETLMEIADKFDINWKKLARINNLKPPYELKEGDILYIPKKGKEKKIFSFLKFRK